MMAITSTDVPIQTDTPNSYQIAEGTTGILEGKSVLPELVIVEFELDESSTARVEVRPDDIEAVR